MVATVREARPDILVLAVPSQHKEYFLARCLGDLRAPGRQRWEGSFVAELTGLNTREAGRRACG